VTTELLGAWPISITDFSVSVGGRAGLPRQAAAGDAFGAEETLAHAGRDAAVENPRPEIVSAKGCLAPPRRPAGRSAKQTMHFGGIVGEVGGWIRPFGIQAALISPADLAKTWFLALIAVAARRAGRPRPPCPAARNRPFGGAGEAVEWMVGDVQLHHGPLPQLLQPLGLGVARPWPFIAGVVQEGWACRRGPRSRRDRGGKSRNASTNVGRAKLWNLMARRPSRARP